MKPGELVRLVSPDEDDNVGSQQTRQSATLFSEPGSLKKNSESGYFLDKAVGTVLETKTYVKVFVGASVGWIPAEEIEVAEEG
jgi:hypothetical protein